jgi:hypothetical protein
VRPQYRYAAKFLSFSPPLHSDGYSLQEILDAPMIWEPLTKLQCCPTSDGGGAAVLASDCFVREWGLEARSSSARASWRTPSQRTSSREDSRGGFVGGSRRTSGAIAGAIAGAVVGDGGIPDRWIRGICDWPRGPRLLATVADRLAVASGGGKAAAPVRYFWPGAVARNLFFLAVVLAHGFRRLAPPYG